MAVVGEDDSSLVGALPSPYTLSLILLLLLLLFLLLLLESFFG